LIKNESYQNIAREVFCKEFFLINVSLTNCEWALLSVQRESTVRVYTNDIIVNWYESPVLPWTSLF